MSDFWSNILGNNPPEETQPPPQSDLPWWKRPLVDVPLPQSSPPAPGQPQQNDPAQQLDPEQSRAKTQWARDTSGNCPSCGSQDYSRHPENPTARPRCFSCGYPLVQSGSGLASLLPDKNMGPVKEARQIPEARTNNFNPRHIMRPQ